MKLLQLFLLPLLAGAFVAPNKEFGAKRTMALSSVPSYNRATEKWEYTSSDQEPSAGYDAVGTLLRHGPKPFFSRVFDGENYEQAVLKFMAGEDCDRNTAQGNMDAYLRNPNDWAFYRNEEKKSGYRPDYVALDAPQLMLTITWGAFISLTLTRVVFCMATRTPFWEIPMLGLH